MIAFIMKGHRMRLNIILKYLLSFRKKDWTFNDYPLRINYQAPTDADANSRLELVPWHVVILNWAQMFGTGDTKEAAFNDLHQKLSAYKQEHGQLPRPGTHVPLQFAPSIAISQYEPEVRDFFERILDMEYDNVFFVSDQSSLWHFNPDKMHDRYIQKIRDVYEVDITDIDDGNLVQILKRIRTHQHPG